MAADSWKLSRPKLVEQTATAAESTAAISSKSGKISSASLSSMEEICFMDGIDLAGRIRRKDLSSVEVMTAFLDRIEALNPRHNAIVSMVDRKTALDMARQADADLVAGKPVGKLHGLPWAIKDLDDATGLPTTMGSPIFKDRIAASDGLLTARIRAAGALIIGKTNVPEFGAGSHTFNSIFGTTRNAFDPALSAGGSSGGAAVALATGMMPMLDGSDTGGSLRNPASWNNIVALRPSIGRVPMDFPLGWFLRLPVHGPMARSTRDVAYLLSIFAGQDARDPISLRDDPAMFAAPLDRDFKGVKVAWTPDLGYLPIEPEIAEATAQALPALQAIGCEVESAHPVLSGAFETHKTLRSTLVAAWLQPFFDANRDRIKAEMVWDVENGRKLSALDVAHAEANRALIARSTRKLLESYEFLVMPVTQVAPFPIERQYPTEINGRKMRTYMEWMESSYVITLTGLPAASAPCAFTRSGLPVGLQIIGRANDDFGVLQLANAFEKAAGAAYRRARL